MARMSSLEALGLSVLASNVEAVVGSPGGELLEQGLNLVVGHLVGEQDEDADGRVGGGEDAAGGVRTCHRGRGESWLGGGLPVSVVPLDGGYVELLLLGVEERRGEGGEEKDAGEDGHRGSPDVWMLYRAL